VLWTKAGAVVVSLLTGRSEVLQADCLVLATTNVADTQLRRDLAARGITATPIGDANAPRNAAMAFFDGRKVGIAL
jgi:hypothetical protein